MCRCGAARPFNPIKLCKINGSFPQFVCDLYAVLLDPTLAYEDSIKRLEIYDGKETSTPGNATNDQGLQHEESCTMLNFLLNMTPSQRHLF